MTLRGHRFLRLLFALYLYEIFYGDVVLQVPFGQLISFLFKNIFALPSLEEKKRLMSSRVGFE